MIIVLLYMCTGYYATSLRLFSNYKCILLLRSINNIADIS